MKNKLSPLSKILLSITFGMTVANAHAVVFQAENDTAYFDTTLGNTGGAYRSDNVDIQATSDTGGGHNVGWIDTGEWLKFNNLSIPSSGNYTIRMRVASPNNGGSASVDLNGGAIVLGSVNIPNTGGWQTWQTVSINAYINAGTYSLGVYAETAGWNFNWIEVVPAGSNNTSNVVNAFGNCYYGGWKAGLDVGNYNLGALQSRGFVNEDASSFKVAAGYEAVLYQYDNFTGSSITLRSDDDCLVNKGFNDVITSVIVRPVAPASGVAKVYQHCNYTGWSANLDVGNYNLAALQSRGFTDNDASSLRIAAGYEAVLYQNDNFGGSSTVITADTGCLVGGGFNDNVSSIVIKAAATSAKRTAAQLMASVYRGTNYGQHHEAGRTDPIPTDDLDTIRANGFNLIRIPVKWDDHADGYGNINTTYFNNVKTSVDRALARGFMVVLDTHHENWLDTNFNTTTLNRLKTMWKQIGNGFKGYSDRLIYETLNEPHVMSEANVDLVNNEIRQVIRNVVGEKDRTIFYAVHSWNWSTNVEKLDFNHAFDPYVGATIHYYHPNEFTHKTAWSWPGTGDNSQQRLLELFDQVEAWSNRTGYSIFLGEFGVNHGQYNHDWASVLRYYNAVSTEARKRGWGYAVWEDDGWFKLFDRDSNTYITDLKNALAP